MQLRLETIDLLLNFTLSTPHRKQHLYNKGYEEREVNAKTIADIFWEAKQVSGYIQYI